MSFVQAVIVNGHCQLVATCHLSTFNGHRQRSLSTVIVKSVIVERSNELSSNVHCRRALVHRRKRSLSNGQRSLSTVIVNGHRQRLPLSTVNGHCQRSTVIVNGHCQRSTVNSQFQKSQKSKHINKIMKILLFWHYLSFRFCIFLFFVFFCIYFMFCIFRLYIYIYLFERLNFFGLVAACPLQFKKLKISHNHLKSNMRTCEEHHEEHREERWCIAARGVTKLRALSTVIANGHRQLLPVIVNGHCQRPMVIVNGHCQRSTVNSQFQKSKKSKHINKNMKILLFW